MGGLHKLALLGGLFLLYLSPIHAATTEKADSQAAAHGTNLRLINTDFGKIKDPEGKPVGEPILALMAKQDDGEYEYR